MIWLLVSLDWCFYEGQEEFVMDKEFTLGGCLSLKGWMEGPLNIPLTSSVQTRGTDAQKNTDSCSYSGMWLSTLKDQQINQLDQMKTYTAFWVTLCADGWWLDGWMDAAGSFSIKNNKRRWSVKSSQLFATCCEAAFLPLGSKTQKTLQETLISLMYLY